MLGNCLTSKSLLDSNHVTYGSVGYTKESVPDTTLHAKSNLGFPVTLEDAEMDKSRTMVDGLSIHRPSLALNKCEIIADDTFENILEVTAHHEALMTFYYMDDNDKVFTLCFLIIG